MYAPASPQVMHLLGAFNDPIFCELEERKNPSVRGTRLIELLPPLSADSRDAWSPLMCRYVITHTGVACCHVATAVAIYEETRQGHNEKSALPANSQILLPSSTSHTTYTAAST